MGKYFEVFIDREQEPLFRTDTFKEAVKEVDLFGISNEVTIKDQNGNIVWTSKE